jgi:hypothetical protein
MVLKLLVGCLMLSVYKEITQRVFAAPGEVPRVWNRRLLVAKIFGKPSEHSKDLSNSGSFMGRKPEVLPPSKLPL